MNILMMVSLFIGKIMNHWDEAARTKCHAARTMENNNRVEEAYQKIENAILTFGYENFILAFNGGKDATLVTHLYVNALAGLIERGLVTRNVNKPRALYFKDPDEFEEVTSFINEQRELLDLQVYEIEGGYNQNTMSEALRIMPRSKGHAPIVFVMGIRKSDNASMEELALSTLPGLFYVRYSPLITWTYGDVWNAIRESNIPYCKLYDEGYTSLGTKSNSKKNANLADACKAAYELDPEDWNTERHSRAG